MSKAALPDPMSKAGLIDHRKAITKRLSNDEMDERKKKACDFTVISMRNKPLATNTKNINIEGYKEALNEEEKLAEYEN